MQIRRTNSIICFSIPRNAASDVYYVNTVLNGNGELKSSAPFFCEALPFVSFSIHQYFPLEPLQLEPEDDEKPPLEPPLERSLSLGISVLTTFV